MKVDEVLSNTADILDTSALEEEERGISHHHSHPQEEQEQDWTEREAKTETEQATVSKECYIIYL